MESDINGSGYGDKHSWECMGTPYQGSTRYVCRNCRITFWHNYNLFDDIFEAMKERELPEECVKTAD